MPGVDVRADLWPLVAHRLPGPTMWGEPDATPERLPIGEQRTHQRQVARGSQREVEAVEQPIDDVVEQLTRNRCAGVSGWWLPRLEVVARGERHATAQPVRRVPDRQADDAGDADAADRHVRERVREVEAGCARQELLDRTANDVRVLPRLRPSLSRRRSTSRAR